MSDEKLFTDCAVEATKALAKEIYDDVAKPVLRPAGQLLGLPFSGLLALLSGVQCWVKGKEYKVEETTKILEQKLANIPTDQIESPEPYIAVPALQYISYCMDNEELKNMYANLLASSMNKAVKNGVHPSYLEIIKQLCPDEAKILKYFYKKVGIPVISLRRINDKGIYRKVIELFSTVGFDSGCDLPMDAINYFINLIRLGLIEKGEPGEEYSDKSVYKNLINHPFIKEQVDEIISETEFNTPDYDFGYIKLTPFGNSFCKICLDESIIHNSHSEA